MAKDTKCCRCARVLLLCRRLALALLLVAWVVFVGVHSRFTYAKHQKVIRDTQVLLL
jgi:hypothetical protein